MTITINDNLYNEIVKNGINLQKELSEEMVSLYIQNKKAEKIAKNVLQGYEEYKNGQKEDAWKLLDEL